jgi:hypothetical protein
MIREIKKDGQIFAIIVPGDFTSDKKYNFMSPQDSFLQFGVNYYKPGDVVPNHIHLACERNVTRIEEIIVLRRGAAVLSIFDESEQLIESITLRTGDVAYQMRGGHGFKFLEPSEIFEVKQGPYMTKELDKRQF